MAENMTPYDLASMVRVWAKPSQHTCHCRARFLDCIRTVHLAPPPILCFNPRVSTRIRLSIRRRDTLAHSCQWGVCLCPYNEYLGYTRETSDIMIMMRHLHFCRPCSACAWHILIVFCDRHQVINGDFLRCPSHMRFYRKFPDNKNHWDC